MSLKYLTYKEAKEVALKWLESFSNKFNVKITITDDGDIMIDNIPADIRFSDEPNISSSHCNIGFSFNENRYNQYFNKIDFYKFPYLELGTESGAFIQIDNEFNFNLVGTSAVDLNQENINTIKKLGINDIRLVVFEDLNIKIGVGGERFVYGCEFFKGYLKLKNINIDEIPEGINVSKDSNKNYVYSVLKEDFNQLKEGINLCKISFDELPSDNKNYIFLNSNFRKYLKNKAFIFLKLTHAIEKLDKSDIDSIIEEIFENEKDGFICKGMLDKYYKGYFIIRDINEIL